MAAHLGAAPTRASELGGLAGMCDRGFGYVSAALNALGTLLIVFLMGVINADVMGRFLFSRPITGVTEMVIMAIAAIVFLQFSHTLRSGRVIQADTLLRVVARHSPGAHDALQALFHAIGAIVFSVIVYAAVHFLRRALDSGDVYGNPATFALPKWPVRAVMVVGSVAMVIQFLILAARFGHAALHGRPHDRPEMRR